MQDTDQLGDGNTDTVSASSNSQKGKDRQVWQ